MTNVVAAGNDSTDLALETPAAYDEVMTVTSATDYDGQPGAQRPTPSPPETCPEFSEIPELLGTDDTATPFSNFATLLADQAHTLTAPGVCIGSTVLGSDYGISSGTSFAAPHIAGTAALCISTGKCTGTPAQIIQKLINDAARYNQRHPGYGFVGDPLRPIPGTYYGYLIRAGLY